MVKLHYPGVTFTRPSKFEMRFKCCFSSIAYCYSSNRLLIRNNTWGGGGGRKSSPWDLFLENPDDLPGPEIFCPGLFCIDW